MLCLLTEYHQHYHGSDAASAADTKATGSHLDSACEFNNYSGILPIKPSNNSHSDSLDY